ncbi:MAG: pitrilysin family protein [Candidatus Aminicenantes bacterium]|nr:pitrilysin family protein [Candidatus Aminicenantes bacterium]
MKKAILIGIIAAFAILPLCGANSLPTPQKFKLNNGLTVYYLQDKDLPLVAARMLVKGAGTAFEPAEGLANLTAALMLKGAAGKTAVQVAEDIDSLGAALDISAADEYMNLSASCLAEHFDRLMGIAADCMLKPAFSPEEFEKERQNRIDSLKAAKDNPGQAVRLYFRKAYFGTHPLGHLAGGTDTSLGAMTVGQVRDYYRKYLGPQQAVLAVAGDIEPDRLKQVLNRTFGKWQQSVPAPAAKLPEFPAPHGKVLILVDKPDATQAYFGLGFPGFGMGDDISAAAQVMNTLFGGRFTSWLNTELRIKRGLTYGVSSSFQQWRGNGIFNAFSYTKNDQIGEMLDITLELIAKAKKEGFGEEEIQSARNYILGQFPPTLENLGAKARSYLTLDFYGLGFNYYDGLLERIGKITKPQADAVAGKYFSDQNFVLVVVGRAEEIFAQLAKFGDFKIKKIGAADF